MKHYPLLIILSVSAALLILCGFALPSARQSSLLPDASISSLCNDLHNGGLLSNFRQKSAALQDSASAVTPPSTQASVQPSAQKAALPSEQDTTSQESGQNNTLSSAAALGADVPSFIPVDKSYFDDALFIGDSRMVGMQEYSGLTNATFYAGVGLTVYDLFDKAYISLKGSAKPVTLDTALQEKQFRKIYLMVGINELGTGTLDGFIKTYKAAVARIEQLQPDAIVFIQGILYVTADRSDSDPIFNNDNIRSRNQRLAELADNQRSFYLDINDVTTDSDGNLKKEYSWDNCHLKAQYYGLWTDFLMQHGVAVTADSKE